MRLIDADELVNNLRSYRIDGRQIELDYGAENVAAVRLGLISAIDFVTDAPTAHHVRHGHWVARGGWYCSVCGKECNEVDDPFEVALTDYCGCCGAKMDEVAHETD